MKLKNIFYSIFTCAALLFAATACSPDDYSLGSKDVTEADLVEGIAFTITPDASNPNIIYLESKMPTSYQVLWNHPQGRSQGNKVTLKMPFPGTYEVQMGVETRGGVVYGEKATFTIDEFCSDFVSDPLWTVLTGGVGHSKTWYLDLDENGICRYFSGPIYFYGTADSWNTVTLGQTVDGDSWGWAAGWEGDNRSWLMGSTGAMDYGSMTFSLEDGAKITVNDNAHGRTMNGTFLMDTDNHTMKLTDAEFLHDPGRDAIVTQWGNVTILALDENHMQLAVLRDNDPSEGPCLLSYNFISEDYKNNWTPDDAGAAEIVPDLIEDWRDYVEPKTSKQMTFRLSDEDPFDIMTLEGSPKELGASYAAAAGIEDIRLQFDRTKNEYTYTNAAGDKTTGKFELTDDGIYTFSEGIPVENLSSDGTYRMKSNDDNTLRIMKVEVDNYTGAISSLWLGSKMLDDQGNLIQYMGYHFVPVLAGGAEVKRYSGTLNYFSGGFAVTMASEEVFIAGDGTYEFEIKGANDDPYGLYLDVAKLYKDNNNCDVIIKRIQVDGKDIDFDDTLIDRGTADGDHSTARRYIVNPWGATAGEASKFAFSESIKVTVEVKYDCGSNVLEPEG